MNKKRGRAAEIILLLILGSLILWALELLLIYVDDGYSGRGDEQAPLIWQRDEWALEVHNLRVRKGETVTTQSLARAVAGDGRDLSDKVVLKNEKGEVIQRELPTDTPGCYRYTALLNNTVTHREIKKEVLLLVDGGKFH